MIRTPNVNRSASQYGPLTPGSPDAKVAQDRKKINNAASQVDR